MRCMSLRAMKGAETGGKVRRGECMKSCEEEEEEEESRWKGKEMFREESKKEKKKVKGGKRQTDKRKHR